MDLEAQFNDAMFDIYRRSKVDAGYNAVIFFKMLTAIGGLRAAKKLINSARPSGGYTALYERGRLDLTVEALVIENQCWHSLFEAEELDKARKRLQEYDYHQITS